MFNYGNGWTVGPNIEEARGSVLNRQNTSTHPPTDQWLFSDGRKWNSDNTLILEFTALSTCDLVRVAGQGGVVEKQGGSLGDYR